LIETKATQGEYVTAFPINCNKNVRILSETGKPLYDKIEEAGGAKYD